MGGIGEGFAAKDAEKAIDKERDRQTDSQKGIDYGQNDVVAQPTGLMSPAQAFSREPVTPARKRWVYDKEAGAVVRRAEA